MGKRNRERRAAKKRARRGRGATPPRDNFGWGPHGPGCSCDHGFDEPPFLPPPEESLAEALRSAAHAHVHGDPTAAAACASVVTEEDFAPDRRTVYTAAAMALATTIRGLWRAGWLPVDLWQITRRQADDTAVSLLLDTIAADAAQYAPATVHERWTAQLRQLDATLWWAREHPHLGQWARQHGSTARQAVLTVITLIAELLRLPALPQIVPPPGTATSRATAQTAGVDQKVLARVRALLAKAESTQFPEEADALSAKAQELMNRYAFERALLDADTHTQQTATSTRLWLDSPYVDAKSHLVAAIAGANRCKSVFHPKLGFVSLVGEEVDLEITELLTTSLLVQATRAMVAEGAHITRTGTSRTRSFRQSFLVSYAVRIGERLTEATDRAHDPTTDDKLLPVLARRSRAVENTFNDMFSHTVQKSVSVSNGSGWHAGRQAADRANLTIERQTINA